MMIFFTTAIPYFDEAQLLIVLGSSTKTHTIIHGGAIELIQEPTTRAGELTT